MASQALLSCVMRECQTSVDTIASTIVSDRSHLHQTPAPVPVNHASRGLAISLGDWACAGVDLAHSFARPLATGPNGVQSSVSVRLRACRTFIDGFGPLVTALSHLLSRGRSQGDSSATPRSQRDSASAQCASAQCVQPCRRSRNEAAPSCSASRATASRPPPRLSACPPS